MNINIRSINFTADEKLKDYAERKLSRMEKYFDRILNVDVSFKLDNMNQRIKDKIAEIHIRVPGDVLVVTSKSKTFEGAMEAALRTVKRRIIRYKEKIRV